MLQNGVAVNFTLSGLVLSGTGIGTGVYQSISHKKMSEKIETKDEGGALVNRTWFNPGEEATITYFVKGTGLADVITQTTLPAIGTFATIATCTQYTALNKTTWEIVDAEMKGTNTTAKEVTLKLEFHAGITAATGA